MLSTAELKCQMESTGNHNGNQQGSIDESLAAQGENDLSTL
jgi:hypothetical protein